MLSLRLCLRSGPISIGGAEKLGTVRFATSCSAAAQPAFARAMALLHSFEFGPAIEGFTAAGTTDPGCAIAYWGIALSRWGNPFAAGLKTPAQLEAGRAAIAQATTIGAKTDRERDYIAAAERLFADFEKIDQRTRLLAYRDAMSDLAARYADDPEASAFYALALAASNDPTDQTYASLIKAGAILERLAPGAARPSGLRALHHPRLRCPAARAEGARGGAQLREDRAVGATCAAHAVAHVHPPRLLAGFDRDQHRLGAGRATGGCDGRRAARDGLSGRMPTCRRRRTARRGD